MKIYVLIIVCLYTINRAISFVRTSNVPHTFSDAAGAFLAMAAGIIAIIFQAKLM